MPIVTRVWSPNTCTCSFVVNLNTDLPSDLIDFIFVAVLRNDGLHGPLMGAALLVAAHDDNKLMNAVWGEVEKLQPAILGRNFLFDFDVDRNLEVSFELVEGKGGPGVVLTEAEKTSLRSTVDARFGAGKVSVT